MYGSSYIFYFVHPIVKRVKIMVQRFDFEQIRQLLCPVTVFMKGSNFRVGIYTPSHETAETNSSVFVETDYQRLDVKFRFRVTKGSLSTFPSDLVFEPAFPVRRVLKT